MKACAFAILLGGLCLSAEGARSAPLTAVISVQSNSDASDCPSRERLTRDVEQILHRKLDSADVGEAALEVSVQFSRSRDGYRALVRSLGAKPGERELRDRGPSCTAVGEAASVAIALLLDKELAEPASVPDPPRASSPPRPAPEVPNEKRPKANEATHQRFEPRASFELGASSGLASSAAALGALGLGVRLERTVTIDLLVAAESSRVSEYGGGSVRSSLLLVAARGCYRWGRAIAVGPCLQFARGFLTGEGVGYAAARESELRWLGVGAGGGAEGPVWGNLSWLAFGTLWVPLQRSSFSLENGGTAWQSSQLGATLSGGLAFAAW